MTRKKYCVLKRTLVAESPRLRVSEFTLRITSYNVCYTKLLRDASERARRAADVARPEVERLAREARDRAEERAVREHFSQEISRRMAELDRQGEELSLQKTWRAQAERDLVESEERFLLALEATSDGLWDWNAATGAIYFTPP